jgi:hypothetical protein
MKIHTREKGTKEYITESDGEKIEAFRQVVFNQAYAKIDSVAVDTYSASAVLEVFSRINDENKAKYIKASVPAMVVTAFRLLNKRKA